VSDIHVLLQTCEIEYFCNCKPLQIIALNEAQAGSVRNVFRPWAERLDLSQPTLDSNEDDAELLIHVPFNGSVKIKVFLIFLACICQNAA